MLWRLRHRRQVLFARRLWQNLLRLVWCPKNFGVLATDVVLGSHSDQVVQIRVKSKRLLHVRQSHRVWRPARRKVFNFSLLEHDFLSIVVLGSDEACRRFLYSKLLIAKVLFRLRQIIDARLLCEECLEGHQRLHASQSKRSPLCQRFLETLPCFVQLVEVEKISRLLDKRHSSEVTARRILFIEWLAFSFRLLVPL